jgi:hypothetical protein
MLISVVLVSMAIAILYPALQTYQETEMEHRLAIKMAEIEAAATTAQRHPGSSRTVLIDVPSTGGIRLDRMTIGGELTAPPAETGTIRWSLSSGPSGTRLVSSTSGPVPMSGEDGGPVVLEAFPCLIVLETRAAPPGSHYRSFVQVSVV